MPVGGFAALCVSSSANSHGLIPHMDAPKSAIHGNFVKIKFPAPFDTVKGKLVINFSAYRISHGGIKVCLEGNLQINNQNSGKPFNIFRHCPIENQVTCDDLVSGQQKLNFTLIIPPNDKYPTPFMTSNGSLTYRLVALIKRDDTWELIAKTLLNFKGYYNISEMPLDPSVDMQFFQGGEIKSTFTVANPMVVMGCGESLKATLLLQGLLVENHVNATLIFLKIINYGSNVHTDIIWSRNQLMKCTQNKNILFEWTVVIPLMPRASYSDELIPIYSVRYFLKYEATLGQLNVDKESCMVVKGIVEVKVGTTRKCRGSNTTDDDLNETTCTVASGSSQFGRRTSVLSMLSLPPAYSQLVSRSASLLSLETSTNNNPNVDCNNFSHVFTVPPNYDDL